MKITDIESVQNVLYRMQEIQSSISKLFPEDLKSNKLENTPEKSIISEVPKEIAENKSPFLIELLKDQVSTTEKTPESNALGFKALKEIGSRLLNNNVLKVTENQSVESE